MTKRQDRDAIYVKRQFDTEIIVLCVHWYITYRLSYRDLVAMMAERDVIVSHTTIMRWVIRDVPEFEKRWNRFARSIGRSWRVDETYISIKGVPSRGQARAQHRLHAATGSGALPLRRRSFGRRSPRIRIELRARSHSMATYRATGRCDCCGASTLLGAESKFGVQST